MSEDATVSPDEMAALMDTIQEGAENRIRESADGEPQDIVRYDLVAARSVGRGQLPTLDLVNERLAGLLTDLFGRITGGQVTRASCLPSEAIKFVESSGNLPSPSCLQLVELQGLRGIGIIAFDPTLLFSVFDSLLGGKPGGGSVDADDIVKRRGMTAVEKRLYNRISTMISTEITSAWRGVAHLGARPLRVETDPKHLAIFEPNEMVVDTLFEIEIGDVTGNMHLIIPQSSLRPVEKKLASGLLDVGSDEADSWRTPLSRLLRQITVLCTAELGRTSVALRELMGLKVGDVLRLDRDPENPITLYIEGVPKLMGNPTLQHGNIALEVVSMVNKPKKQQQSQEEDNG